MLLQADAIQIGSGVVSACTLVLVLRLTFGAGELVRQVDVNSKRIDHLEKVACPHQECPFKVRFNQDLTTEREG